MPADNVDQAICQISFKVIWREIWISRKWRLHSETLIQKTSKTTLPRMPSTSNIKDSP